MYRLGDLVEIRSGWLGFSCVGIYIRKCDCAPFCPYHLFHVSDASAISTHVRTRITGYCPIDLSSWDTRLLERHASR